MQICSYRVRPMPGREIAAVNGLNALPGCMATLDRDGSIHLVTETHTDDQEERLKARISANRDILRTSLTFIAEPSCLRWDEYSALSRVK